MPSAQPIRFGFQTAQQNVTWPELLALWQELEQLGFESGWNFDHFIPIFSDPAGPCLEAWTMLGALAAHTSRLRIGTLVTGNTYRHPAVLAKMATTIDVLSGGRFNFGLGAGWFELEDRAFDVAFPKINDRLHMLDEALEESGYCGRNGNRRTRASTINCKTHILRRPPGSSRTRRS